MSSAISDTQVERWRILWEEMASDPNVVAFHRERDEQRLEVQRALLDLLSSFLIEEVEIGELREIYDAKTRTEWDVFGLKGMSGGMFLNKLVKHISDTRALAAELRVILTLPGDTQEGREWMEAFYQFLNEEIRSGRATRNQLQPARTPFFISSWWHLQNPEQWPIFYISGRRAMEAEDLYTPTRDPVSDYFAFRERFLTLAADLGIQSWDLEHLFAWRYEKKTTSTQHAQPQPSTTARADQQEEETEQTELNHTYIQWTLAKIGKKLGCRIWIAANDHNKEW